MEILLTLVLLAPLVWLLERTHRRTRDLPRMPFGVDAESEAADAYRRQLAELRELTQLMGDQPAASSVTPPRTVGRARAPLGGFAGTATIVKPS